MRQENKSSLRDIIESPGGLRARFFLSGAQQRLFRQGLPVFVYHLVGTAPAGSCDPFLYVTPTRFEQQLQALSAKGFSSTSLDEWPLVAGNSFGKIVITFDDGCQAVFRNAMGPLARQGFSAIQFLVARYLGRRKEWESTPGQLPEPLMDQAQVRDWLAAGHEIGSHSATHRNLKRLNRCEAHEEIAGSKKQLEDTFGVPVHHFCYPFGRWNAQVRDCVAEAGYRTACTVGFGVNTPSTPPFELLRVDPLTARDYLRKVRHRLRRKLYSLRQPLWKARVVNRRSFQPLSQRWTSTLSSCGILGDIGPRPSTSRQCKR